MHPVLFFQLPNTMANWSLQEALSSHEAPKEHRPGTIYNEDNTLLKMFAIENEGGISRPDFVGNQMTSKERTHCHGFISQAWWGAEISD